MKNIFSSFVCASLALMASQAVAQVNVSAVPADSSVVEELSSVVLTFDDLDLVDLGTKAGEITLTSDNLSLGCTAAFGDADNQMVVTFEKVTAKGEYHLNVPQNAFVDGNGTAIDEFMLVYRIGSEAAAYLTPAPGEVKWLTKIIYNYDVETTLSADTYNGDKATLTSPSGKVQNLYPEYNWQIGNGKYTLRVLDLIDPTEEGECVVTIPDNLFYCYVDGSRQNLPGGTFTFTQQGGQTEVVSCEPQDQLYNFKHFKVTFPDATSIEKLNKDYLYLCREGKDGYVSQISLDYNVQIEGNALVYNNLYTDVIDPGHYYISFTEDIVVKDGQEHNAPFKMEFDIVEPEAVEVVWTPATDAVVSMLNSVIISFPTVESLTINSSASANLYRVDGEQEISVGGAYGNSNFVKLSDNSVKISFNGLATVEGTYRVKLNKNALLFADGSFNNDLQHDMTFVPAEAPVMTITPADGSVLDKIQTFIVTFPNETKVTVNNALSSKTTILYVGAELVDNGWGGYANQQAGSTSYYTPVEGSTNSFEFKLSQAAINAGDYLLKMPAGIFLIGEDESNYSRAYEAIYTATGEGVDKIEVNPSHPVEKLEELSVTFINETSITPQNIYMGFSLYKVNDTQTWDDYKEYISGENVRVEGNTLYLTPSGEYTEEGEYYIDITAYSLYMSDGVTTSTPQRVSWTVGEWHEDTPTGLTEVKAAADVRCYNLMGQQVKNAKGLMIQNGKVVIK